MNSDVIFRSIPAFLIYPLLLAGHRLRLVHSLRIVGPSAVRLSIVRLGTVILSIVRLSPDPPMRFRS